jgi:hypothetical protein
MKASSSSTVSAMKTPLPLATTGTPRSFAATKMARVRRFVLSSSMPEKTRTLWVVRADSRP